MVVKIKHLSMSEPLGEQSSHPRIQQGLLTILGVPHFHCPVLTAVHDSFAIGAKGHAPDPFAVPLQRQELLAGLGVPDLERPILAATDEAFAIGAEIHT
jgi:hypothetical protein